MKTKTLIAAVTLGLVVLAIAAANKSRVPQPSPAAPVSSCEKDHPYEADRVLCQQREASQRQQRAAS